MLCGVKKRAFFAPEIFVFTFAKFLFFVAVFFLQSVFFMGCGFTGQVIMTAFFTWIHSFGNLFCSVVMMSCPVESSSRLFFSVTDLSLAFASNVFSEIILHLFFLLLTEKNKKHGHSYPFFAGKQCKNPDTFCGNKIDELELFDKLESASRRHEIIWGIYWGFSSDLLVELIVKSAPHDSKSLINFSMKPALFSLFFSKKKTNGAYSPKSLYSLIVTEAASLKSVKNISSTCQASCLMHLCKNVFGILSPPPVLREIFGSAPCSSNARQISTSSVSAAKVRVVH